MTTDIAEKLRVWRCMNVKPDGHVCRNILAEVRAAPGTMLRIVCSKCHAVHLLIGSDVDTQDSRVLNWNHNTEETREVRQ